MRLYSESQVYTISRCEESEPADGGPASEEAMGDGAPFRGRSQSAPAALWAAKRYGRQLRRMSDEFDTWLDRGVSGVKCVCVLVRRVPRRLGDHLRAYSAYDIVFIYVKARGLYQQNALRQ